MKTKKMKTESKEESTVDEKKCQDMDQEVVVHTGIRGLLQAYGSWTKSQFEGSSTPFRYK